MIFNSLHFVLFLPTVFILYWFIFNRKLLFQNLFILLVSYIFYGFWDYRFLFLLIFSTLLDYFTGLKIHQSPTLRTKRIWLFISVFINLGFLGFFKYFNFFIDTFVNLLSSIGLQANEWSLTIILPVGISFYTFHGLSYVLDIYYGKISPTRNFIDYSVFVSFFPLLVAGPIERATHLLPQVKQSRKFDYSKATDGLRQILWGLFKKIVVADTCAIYVDDIFENYSETGSATLLLGAVLFAFQIYGDFSGYSDIALGCARLLGFELLRNFAYPYFSRDIAEFWRRWHISLSSWFRDYLYFPLGGSRVSVAKQIQNTFIIFLVSGFWHGANWTFIVWGTLNALYFLPLLLTGKNRKNLGEAASGKRWPSFSEFMQILLTFMLTVLAWIFFRSETVSDAFAYLSGIFQFSQGIYFVYVPPEIYFFIALLIMVEWLQRHHKHALELHHLQMPMGLRWSIYLSVSLLIGMYFGNSHTFIYFQF